MGSTQIVPGISGGTIGIIMGFYFELIEAINHFAEDIRKSLKLLVPLVIGCIAGLILFSSIVNFLLSYYSFPAMLFFIGLIAGIIPHVYWKIKEDNSRLLLKDILAVLIPFFILLAISVLKGLLVSNSAEVIPAVNFPYMIFLFFSGIIAAAALVIPGVSGAFMLLLLGTYPLIIYTISSVRLLLTDITNITLLLDICKVLAPLGLGAIIGGLVMIRLIEIFLKKYAKVTYCIILGLLLGSFFVLFREPIVFQSGISSILIIIGIITFSLGSTVSYILGNKQF